MIKYLFSLLFLGLSILVLGQDKEINQLNDRGQKTGHWIVLDENGNKRYDAYFVDDQPIGTMTRYYPDGVIKAIMDHDSTGRKVNTKLFDESGKLRADGQYIDRIKEGRWSYYSSHGIVLIEINYKSDTINGQGIRYFANGNIMEKTNWLNNTMHGIQQIFNEDGAKVTEIYYRNNQMDGAYLAFYPSGELAIKGTYRQNLKDGEWIYYFADGKTDYSLSYSRGKLLNPDVLDQRQKDVFDQYEKNKNMIKDPIMYLRDPASYFRR